MLAACVKRRRLQPAALWAQCTTARLGRGSANCGGGWYDRWAMSLGRCSCGEVGESMVTHFISEEEYLVLERASEVRHEYYRGKMVAMAGASERHGAIISSTQFRLYGQLRGSPCRVYSTDLRVSVNATGQENRAHLVEFNIGRWAWNFERFCCSR